ncbi:MAG: nascent polypeptide-associated complex protein [Candidatus Woesearchaeota archaeon]
MIPGMNSRQAQQMMKKMGIQQQEIPVKELIMKCDDYILVIQNPQVSKVNMMGQQMYQVIGEAQQQAIETELHIDQQDIQTVVEQTGVSTQDAQAMIKKHNGDLAAAIMELRDAQ